MDDTVTKERQYWEDYIKAEAERAGIDTRGIVGGALLHTMVDRINHLQALVNQQCQPIR